MNLKLKEPITLILALLAIISVCCCSGKKESTSSTKSHEAKFQIRPPVPKEIGPYIFSNGEFTKLKPLSPSTIQGGDIYSVRLFFEPMVIKDIPNFEIGNVVQRGGGYALYKLKLNTIEHEGKMTSGYFIDRPIEIDYQEVFELEDVCMLYPEKGWDSGVYALSSIGRACGDVTVGEVPTRMYLFRVTTKFIESLLQKYTENERGVFVISNDSLLSLDNIPGEVDRYEDIPFHIPQAIVNLAPKIERLDGIIIIQENITGYGKYRRQAQFFSLEPRESVQIRDRNDRLHVFDYIVNNVVIPEYKYWSFFSQPNNRYLGHYFMPTERLENERFYALIINKNIYPFYLSNATAK